MGGRNKASSAEAVYRVAPPMRLPLPPKTLRALAIGAVLCLQALDALPWGRGLSRQTLQSPRGQEELGRWVQTLSGIGLEATAESLGDGLLAASGAVDRLRKLPRKVAGPAYRLTGIGQGWAYFAYPNTRPHRLEIDGRVADTWTLRYRGLDADHDWLAPQLRYRRLRGLYNTQHNRQPATWEAFGVWLGERLHDADPAVDAVRVRLVRTRTTRPDQTPDPRVKKRFERVHPVLHTP